MTTHEQYRDDLPLLAAGALSVEEEAELQRHLQGCAGCREELAELQMAMAQAGIAQGGIEPPVHLRARVLSQVLPKSKRIALPARKAWLFWAWVPALAALVFAVLAFENWRSAQEVKEENRRLVAEAQDRESVLQSSRALMNTLTAPDALHVTLTAAGKPAPPVAKTIYSAQQHALVLTANNLAALPRNKAYQLWLLPQQGAPVPYGTFKPDSHGNAVLVMTSLAPQTPKAFAITIEQESGSAAPTSPVVLTGSL